MTEIIAIRSVEVILFGVLKVQWRDGFAGVVDLRPVFADGEMFEFLRSDPTRFEGVQMDKYGHKIFWIDDEEDEIDFGSSSLRKRAERQAEILRLAS